MICLNRLQLKSCVGKHRVCRVTGPGDDGGVLLQGLAPGRRQSRTILPECAPKCYCTSMDTCTFSSLSKLTLCAGTMLEFWAGKIVSSMMVV